MIGRLALRSLTAHPVRSAVLAFGFGTGVGVMAILLGVAEVVLDQAISPALVGGGDVLVRMAPMVPARVVLGATLQQDPMRARVRAASPFHTADLFLIRDNGTTVEVDARGGVPTLERALDDPEIQQVPAWTDAGDDQAWLSVSPEDGLRQIDRFHDIPESPRWAASWSEWLYFNGTAADARFYLTFLVGPRLPDGRRAAGVRLQLDRHGQVESYSASTPITDADVRLAPDLTIGSNRVRLDGLRYAIDLDLVSARGAHLRGVLSVTGSPGRLVPPLEVSGAKGWVTGYVVPVMSGTVDGDLQVDGTSLAFRNAAGYHDHNWGFWEGVSWQWGQVQNGGVSFLYGRVFPPPEAADPERIPGFLGALGPDGPLGYATNLTIREQNDPRGQPTTIAITGTGPALNLQLTFKVDSTVTTKRSLGATDATALNFLQMRGTYTVGGEAGDRTIAFSAPGSAETFRAAKF